MRPCGTTGHRWRARWALVRPPRGGSVGRTVETALPAPASSARPAQPRRGPRRPPPAMPETAAPADCGRGSAIRPTAHSYRSFLLFVPSPRAGVRRHPTGADRSGAATSLRCFPFVQRLRPSDSTARRTTRAAGCPQPATPVTTLQTVGVLAGAFPAVGVARSRVPQYEPSSRDTRPVRPPFGTALDGPGGLRFCIAKCGLHHLARARRVRCTSRLCVGAQLTVGKNQVRGTSAERSEMDRLRSTPGDVDPAPGGRIRPRTHGR